MIPMIPILPTIPILSSAKQPISSPPSLHSLHSLTPLIDSFLPHSTFAGNLQELAALAALAPRAPCGTVSALGKGIAHIGESLPLQPTLLDALIRYELLHHDCTSTSMLQ